MRTIDIIERLCDKVETLTMYHGENIENLFGDYKYIVNENAISNKCHGVIAAWSDCDNPFRDYVPDAIVVLEDGRCIFMYAFNI